ncbi:MAG TPA: hypothetical protein GX509_05425 [Firmicutes bacterium]|nr:hypothetical protein [Bacillota bacterium]
MLSRFKTILLLALVALVSASLSYSWLSYQQQQTVQSARDRITQYLKAGKSSNSKAATPLDGAAGKAATGATIGKDTIVVTRVIYECGHEEVESRDAPPEMIGLDREGLKTECKDWNIVEFSPGRVILESHRPGMSPKCRRTMHVGVKDGFVAVFYGTPAARCQVKSITQIPVSGLPPAEREDLEKGIVVSGEEELLKLLEGLSESRIP